MDSRFVSPILMWAIALSGATAISALVPPLQVFQKSPATDIAAAFLFLNWIGFFLLGTWQHRQAGKSAAEIKELHTAGIYSLMRHPIYFADMSLTTGIFLFMPFLNVLLSAAFVLAVICTWAGIEENAMERKFGKKYRDYRKKVPKFFPKLL